MDTRDLVRHEIPVSQWRQTHRGEEKMIPDRVKHAALWAYIDQAEQHVNSWPYWKRGGSIAEAEDRARAERKAQEASTSHQ